MGRNEARTTKQGESPWVFDFDVWITPFWEDRVDELIGDVRADRLLLGSDWLTAEGTRQPLDFLQESLAPLPEDDVQRIGRENALELLNISLP